MEKNIKWTNSDGLYVGRGVKNIEFKSTNAKKPAMFYFVSYPAHTSYPDKHINILLQSTPKNLVHCQIQTKEQFISIFIRV